MGSARNVLVLDGSRHRNLHRSVGRPGGVDEMERRDGPAVQVWLASGRRPFTGSDQFLLPEKFDQPEAV